MIVFYSFQIANNTGQSFNITTISKSKPSFVKENRSPNRLIRSPNPKIFVSDERMHLSPSSPDKDVNAQSLLREIENLKNELTDAPH